VRRAAGHTGGNAPYRVHANRVACTSHTGCTVNIATQPGSASTGGAAVQANATTPGEDSSVVIIGAVGPDSVHLGSASISAPGGSTDGGRTYRHESPLTVQRRRHGDKCGRGECARGESWRSETSGMREQADRFGLQQNYSSARLLASDPLRPSRTYRSLWASRFSIT